MEEVWGGGHGWTASASILLVMYLFYRIIDHLLGMVHLKLKSVGPYLFESCACNRDPENVFRVRQSLISAHRNVLSRLLHKHWLMEHSTTISTYYSSVV
jgi:hypothetical protein